MKGSEEEVIGNSAYDSNIILRAIYDTVGRKFNPYASSFVLLFVVPFIIVFLSSFFEGTLLIGGDGLGFLEDFPLILIMLIIALVVTFGYRFFEEYRHFFNKMEPVVDLGSLDEEEYEGYIDQADLFIKGEKKYSKTKWTFYGIWTISSVYFVAISERIYSSIDSELWRSPEYLSTYIIWTIYLLFVSIFILGPLLYRFVAIISVLNRLPKYLYKRKALRIVPLSPDNSGGLRPIGDLALTFNMIIVLPMFYIASNVLRWGLEADIFIQLGVYTVFLCLVFFVPLTGSHNIMKKTKEEMLQKITSEFNQLYFRVYGENRIGELSKANRKQLRQLEMLDRLSKSYEIVDRMPVWPFDMTIIRNFLLTILIPLVFVLIEVLA
ncbi:MAG: hypothetical protein ACMUIE_02575 [Thermoplasmatota archaeon]